ncbi:MAG: hypothetical protein IPQ21_00020 [Betaproteobacteria bacterium]|nr:hypothetical protein [Betaproteobacteria bacterium]
MIGLLFVFIILVVVLALEQRRQERAIEIERAGLRGAGDPREASPSPLETASRERCQVFALILRAA